MMSERSVKRTKDIEVDFTWSDVWDCVPALLENTDPKDVRWCHVERMKKLYESMLAKFEEKSTANDEVSL